MAIKNMLVYLFHIFFHWLFLLLCSMLLSHNFLLLSCLLFYCLCQL